MGRRGRKAEKAPPQILGTPARQGKQNTPTSHCPIPTFRVEPSNKQELFTTLGELREWRETLSVSQAFRDC